MTENDEKLAEEFAITIDHTFQGCKQAFLAGIAHERARFLNKIKPEYRDCFVKECICGEINARNCPVHQVDPTVDFGTFKARVEDL